MEYNSTKYWYLTKSAVNFMDTDVAPFINMV